MKYNVIRNDFLDGLINEVNRQIEHGGWEPIGGIAVSGCPNSVRYCQAMIQKDTENDGLNDGC